MWVACGYTTYTTAEYRYCGLWVYIHIIFITRPMLINKTHYRTISHPVNSNNSDNDDDDDRARQYSTFTVVNNAARPPVGAVTPDELNASARRRVPHRHDNIYTTPRPAGADKISFYRRTRRRTVARSCLRTTRGCTVTVASRFSAAEVITRRRLLRPSRRIVIRRRA